jgi:hypothetical protein
VTERQRRLRRLVVRRRPSAVEPEGLSPAQSLLILVGPLAFLVLFFFYPLGSVMARGTSASAG